MLATDINPTTLAELEGMNTFRLDVTDVAAIGELFADAGEFDVVFNGAGYVHQGSILDYSDEADWRQSWDINVTAMFHICKAAVPEMLRRGGGSIINMASVASSIKGVPNRFAYSATKAAVIGLTRSIAADFVGQGVRCNAICPGYGDEPFAARADGGYSWRSRRGAEELRRSPADGPARRARRSRRARRLSGVR